VVINYARNCFTNHDAQDQVKVPGARSVFETEFGAAAADAIRDRVYQTVEEAVVAIGVTNCSRSWVEEETGAVKD